MHSLISPPTKGGPVIEPSALTSCGSTVHPLLNISASESILTFVVPIHAHLLAFPWLLPSLSATLGTIQPSILLSLSLYIFLSPFSPSFDPRIPDMSFGKGGRFCHPLHMCVCVYIYKVIELIVREEMMISR